MVFEAASSFIASWLTPTCLFIFLNLVIGTIAIMCRFTTHHHRSQLARSTSLMDRLMSFNLCSYRFQTPLESKEVDHHHDSVQENHDSARLSRADESVLDRVNSSQEEDSPEIMDNVAQHELTRTPSLLERLKSLKFYKSESIKKVKDEEPELEPGRQPGAADTGLGRMNSEEGRRRNLSSRRWEGEELLGEEVDKKADDFINRFKQQLRLQRLDSILRYREVIKRN